MIRSVTNNISGRGKFPIMTKLVTPYFAVIFISLKSSQLDGYAEMADKMVTLAKQQPGFLDLFSAQADDGRSVTISYWQSLQAISDWKANAEHQAAQAKGHRQWYDYFRLEIAEVKRAYEGYREESDQ